MIITDEASKKIKELISNQNLSMKDTYLRVAVFGGGCSGMIKKLSFVDKSEITENDIKFDINDCNIVIDIKSVLYLSNCSIIYKNSLMGAGFSIEIPGSRGCGCGESFSV